MKESAFRIDAGNDGLSGDFFAIFEHNTGDRAVFDANLRNFRVHTNFRARFLGGLGEHAGERAKAAPRKSSGTDGMGIRGGAKEQNCR